MGIKDECFTMEEAASELGYAHGSLAVNWRKICAKLNITAKEISGRVWFTKDSVRKAIQNSNIDLSKK
jgi:hypothetical protein